MTRGLVTRCLRTLFYLGVLGSAVPARAQIQAGAETGIDTAVPDLQTLSRTRERPLFTPGRRPPVAPAPVPAVRAVAAPAPKVEPVETEQFALTGIVKGQETHVAVLRNARTNEVFRVKRGDRVLGWSVDGIEARTVDLNKDGKTIRLELFPEVKQ